MFLFRTTPQNLNPALPNDESLHHFGSKLPGRDRPAKKRKSIAPLLLIILLAILATSLSYRLFNKRFDRELHRAVSMHLAQLFPQCSIYVGQVAKDGSGNIVASDVCFAAKSSGPRKSIMMAQRVVVRGDLDIANWIQDSISVRQVDLFGMQIDAWPTGEKTWSVSCLTPQPRPNSTPPTVFLHEAIVRLRRNADLDSQSVALHHISGSVTPMDPPAPIRTHSNPPGLTATLSGGTTGTVDKFQITASYDPATETFSATGFVRGVHLTRTLSERLPPELAAYLAQFLGLECEASAEFDISKTMGSETSFKFKGNLLAGRLQDPRLPYPLENLRSDFYCENSQIQIRNLRTLSGGAEIELNANIQGLGMSSPMTIVAEVRHLDLDQRLYQSLPQPLQEQWNKLQLAGRVSGNVQLDFDGRRWNPSLSVTCENVKIQPWLFPYPLENLNGLVTCQNNRVSCQQMVGRAGGQEVVGSFSMQRQETEWIGRLDCQATDAVLIDETLLNAMTQRGNPTSGGEQFVRSLNPAGSIKLTNATFERTSIEDTWHRNIDANVYGGSIRFAGFQYPISDIRGRIVGNDEHWWLDRFEGRNGGGRILCSGSWLSVKSGSVPMDLNFEALSVPIEEELKLALPAEARFVWDELRPSGSIDQVTVHMRRPNNSAAVKTVVQISEQSSTNAAAGRSLRIHPKTFPYSLTDVDCEINYTPGLVVIEHATGVNGASRISLKGICEPTKEGRWRAKVDWLPQTRLIVESELLKALPKSIRESLVKIDFRGPLSVLGSSEVLFANAAENKLSTSWDCQLAVEDGQLADGKNIGNLRGTVWMQGYSDGTQLNATGSVAMDAMTVRGIPITRLEGPFAVLGSSLYFGSRVSEALPQVNQKQENTMTANALSGKLTISGQGRLDIGKFYLNAGLRSAQLSLLLKDLGVQTPTTEAVCEADLEFNGIPWNPQTFDGHGRIHLSEANLYQLPFMIRLMRVASVNASDDSAFQTADINFDIVGDRIPLQVACDGEVLRLRGEGWTNLRREIDLDLYSYVGRRIPIANVLSPMLAESRYATFMLIEVEGSLDNPVMQRRAFPQLEATFQQIFPEIAENRERGTLRPWKR